MAETRHPLVRLAAEAIQAFVVEQRVLDPPESLFAQVPEAHDPAGAFVSLKRGGQLRGCIGSTAPTRPTLAAEVINSAIRAATRDPRFPAVDRVELDDLVVSVDILRAPVPIHHLSELDPRRYGVIVRSGLKQGVLLPDIEGIDSVMDQVAVARDKAGLTPEEVAEFFRFEVTRYR